MPYFECERDFATKVWRGGSFSCMNPSRSYQTKVKLPHMVQLGIFTYLLGFIDCPGSDIPPKLRESREDRLGRVHDHSS